MEPTSLWSVASEGSILSIASRGSILSIGSAGSILSIGSAGSIASCLSVGSAASCASGLSWRSFASLLDAGGKTSIMGRPMSQREATAVVGALALAAGAFAVRRHLPAREGRG